MDIFTRVVAVGGDGLFSELLQGLLYRTRADCNLPLYEEHKPFSKELTPPLRIGLIPAGNQVTRICDHLYLRMSQAFNCLFTSSSRNGP